MLLLLFVGHAYSAATPAVLVDTPIEGPEATADRLAGCCVAFLVERSRLQAQRSASLEPLLRDASALDLALAVLAVPQAKPAQAQEQRDKGQELIGQIEELCRVLDGRASPPSPRLTRQDVCEQIRARETALARQTLLARAYEAEGQDRISLLETIRLKKEDLTQQIESIARPYEQRMNWLTAQVQRFGPGFERVMLDFANRLPVGAINIQGVRLHQQINEGRLAYSWTDEQGKMVASASLWLRARPDTLTDPPLIHDRYPVLLQNQQEVQISAGYFLIEFRVSVDELTGQASVLNAATTLLDIDRLGQLVPRTGWGGLD